MKKITKSSKYLILLILLIINLSNPVFAFTYTKNSWPTYSGHVISCDGSDTRVECRDSGNGRNHWCTPYGTNSCQAFEGRNNYGSPGCLITCQQVPVVQKCGDGTVYGQCSFNIPFFCDNGNLIKRASFCGCVSPKVISGDDCITVQKCSDNTIYGQCSTNKPLFCDNGNLVNKANNCGCPSGQVVSGDNCVANVTQPSQPITQPSQASLSITNKLSIIDIDVEVDGRKSSNIRDNDKISKEAKPGSEIELKISLKNEFNKSEDIDIEDIQVKAAIENIHSDLEEESKEFDLRAQDDKTSILKFKIPLDVEEDTYNIAIEAEGEDENGNEHSDDADIELEVEKETHDLRFLSFDLFPKIISCSRELTANFKAINIGKEDEENAVLELSSDIPDFDFVKQAFPLASSTQALSSSIKFKINDKVGKGLYSIIASIRSDDGVMKDKQSIPISVEKCEKIAKEGEVVLITPPIEEKPEIVKKVQYEFVKLRLPTLFSLKGLNLITILIILALLLLFLFILIFLIARKTRTKVVKEEGDEDYYKGIDKEKVREYDLKKEVELVKKELVSEKEEPKVEQIEEKIITEEVKVPERVIIKRVKVPRVKVITKKVRVPKRVIIKKVRVPPFVASTEAKRYHTIKCGWARIMKRKNKVYFNTRKKAEAKGFKPHKCVTYKKVYKKAEPVIKKEIKIKTRKIVHLPKFVASKEANKYHSTKCSWARIMKRKNKVYFNTRKKAEAQGFKPHECAS